MRFLRAYILTALALLPLLTQSARCDDAAQIQQALDKQRYSGNALEFSFRDLGVLPATKVLSAAAGNFDGGRSEQIAIATESEGLQIGRYESARMVWSRANGIPEQVHPTAVVAGDLNADQKADLTLYDAAADSWWVLFSEPGHTFRAQQLFALGAGISPQKLLIADVNRDAFPDLVIRKLVKSEIGIAYGAADAIFARPVATPWDPANELIDYYTDNVTREGGDQPGAEPSRVRMLRCNFVSANCSSALVEAAATDIPITWATFPYTAQKAQTVFADFTGDGRSDLLSWRASYDGWWSAISIGALGLEFPVRGLPEVEQSSIVVSADIDADGRDEILVTNASTNSLGAGFSRFDLETFQHSAGSHAAVSLAKESADGSTGPYVCVAYNPGSVGKWGKPWGPCPKGYALLAMDDAAGPAYEQAQISVDGICCRLPSPDILTDEVAYAAAECPDGFIATGAKAGAEPCRICKKELHCTRINANRYQLGSVTPGAYWGEGLSMRGLKMRAELALAPVGFRYALGRWTISRWDLDGCVGQPWGSLLINKARKCQSLRFRQLQYRGSGNDPLPGTPVKMFPDCKYLPNVFDPSAGCVE